ncbi:MAG: ATP-binding domain-containing protein, partial [Acidobacteria bacterium]|nr:ATP-binding domain-containing protein [Acidobacteriota bacterium]
SGPTVLMTLHSAKGLEFGAVLMTGCEEGLLPHGRSLDSDADLEEERRLFYVGLTRAKRRVFLSSALRRRARGVPEERRPSRFLAEIPRELFRDVRVPFGEEEDSEAGVVAGASGGEPRAFNPAPVVSAFKLGQRVRHPTLGVGTVIGMEGGGENLKLTISFSGTRARKILPRYTHLRALPPGGSS